MPPSRPLQVAAVVAGAGALVGAGVALGRQIGRGDEAAPSLWPEEILTLRYQGLDIHRRAPGSYVARAGDTIWTVPRYIKSPRLRIGTVTLTAPEWRVIGGMLEAGWSLLDVVPGGRRVHDIRLALKELPLESQHSLIIERPIQIIRRVSDRLFYGVDHPRGGSDPIPHLPTWDRQRDHVLPHGLDLTRRQWVLYTGILEAAWLVGETMDGSIGGGPEDEGEALTMARSTEWELVPMAAGDPRPAWPLPSVTPKFATWSFGGGRPFGCAEDKCERWHAGIDLTGAPDGALVVSPEDAVVVAVDRGWSEGSKAAFLRAHSGLFLVLGGFKAGSHRAHGVAAGQSVKKGARLGAVLGSYGMIHLETYAADDHRTANSVWLRGEPPPKGILNPTQYVERMVGGKVSLVQTRQRHDALRALGFFSGDIHAPWGDASTKALRAAQTALGIAVDGTWGPETEDAIQRALVAKGACVGAECAAEHQAAAAASTGMRVLKVAAGITAGVALLAGVRSLTTPRRT